LRVAPADGQRERMSSPHRQAIIKTLALNLACRIQGVPLQDSRHALTSGHSMVLQCSLPSFKQVLRSAPGRSQDSQLCGSPWLLRQEPETQPRSEKKPNYMQAVYHGTMRISFDYLQSEVGRPTWPPPRLPHSVCFEPASRMFRGKLHKNPQWGLRLGR
jgi:hypothetical protein